MTPNRVFFSRQDDDKLITLIKSNPVMWDRTIKNFNLKEEIWEEIGKKLDKKVSDCKTRWKTMRDYFKRQTRKKLSKGSSSEINSRFQSLMFLHTEKEKQAIMNIVTRCPEIKVEEDDLSITQSEEQNDSNEDDSEFLSQTHSMEDEDLEQIDNNKTNEINIKSESSSSLKQETSYSELQDPWESKLDWKMKISERSNKIENQGVDLFFESIISTVKTFPATHIAKAKLEILNIITKMELELLQDKSFTSVVTTTDTGTSP